MPNLPLARSGYVLAAMDLMVFEGRRGVLGRKTSLVRKVMIGWDLHCLHMPCAWRVARGGQGQATGRRHAYNAAGFLPLFFLVGGVR